MTVLCFISNNYLIFDRYWLKRALTIVFHPIKRLWRSFYKLDGLIFIISKRKKKTLTIDKWLNQSVLKAYQR